MDQTETQMLDDSILMDIAGSFMTYGLSIERYLAHQQLSTDCVKALILTIGTSLHNHSQLAMLAQKDSKRFATFYKTRTYAFSKLDVILSADVVDRKSLQQVKEIVDELAGCVLKELNHYSVETVKQQEGQHKDLMKMAFRWLRGKDHDKTAFVS